MIAFLNGKIRFVASNWIILGVNGVGYKVFVSPKLIENKKLELENLAQLYIYEHIREDADDFYGLESPEELMMFEMLVSVSGVGPKMAMNILSIYDKNKISQIIINSDVSSLTVVSGVGKKLAMKMILDLKSKLDSGAISNFDDFDNSSEDLFSALEALGYKKYEVSPLVSKIPEELLTVEQKVKWILKQKK
jgi:Holliday junction DNA helicase RuvA